MGAALFKHTVHVYHVADHITCTLAGSESEVESSCALEAIFSASCKRPPQLTVEICWPSSASNKLSEILRSCRCRHEALLIV